MINTQFTKGYKQALKDYGIVVVPPFKPIKIIKEIFVPITNQPRYTISNLGRVYSEKTKRFLKSFVTRNGYEAIYLCTKNKIYRYTVHSLVANHFLGNMKQPGFVINHWDGNKLNNRADNLQWTTSSENNKHTYRLGHNVPKYGEDHPLCKLSNAQVLEINELIAKKFPQKEIASRYHISTGLINKIKKGIRQ